MRTMETQPVCCRCVRPLGDQFVTVHREADGQAVAVCYDCATAKERRAQAERRAKGVGW